MAEITKERAERIARAQPCEQCREYSYKKVSVKAASDAHRKELKEAWHAVVVCGICNLESEIGIDDDGDVLYIS